MLDITYRDAPLPWQLLIWQQLHTRFHRNNLPHALLLSGADGFGQGLFAKAFARSLLTEGSVAKMHLFDSGNHPDFFHIQPAADSYIIKLDQIRDLQAKLAQSQHSSSARIVLFEPAHALNIAATNALLKLVEEPTVATFLFFVASHPRRLKATLRSRCQEIKFNKQDQAISLAWVRQQLVLNGTTASSAEYFLALAEGAPLLALSLSKKSAQQLRKDFFIDVNTLLVARIAPSALAAKWAKHDADSLLCLLLIWLLDLTRLHHKIPLIHSLSPYYCETLSQWQNKLDLYKLFSIVQELYRIRALLAHTTSMDMQSTLEIVFIMLL